MARPPKWNGPTTALRVPAHCAPQLEQIARLLDSDPDLNWDAELPPLPQAVAILDFFHGYVLSLLLEAKRRIRAGEEALKVYEDIFDTLGTAHEKATDAAYYGFCVRSGQKPDPNPYWRQNGKASTDPNCTKLAEHNRRRRKTGSEPLDPNQSASPAPQGPPLAG